MIDAKLVGLADEGADLAIEAGDLAPERGLETAVLLSLFSDRRAPEDSAGGSLDSEPRGWWGEAPPDRYGSLLWTLSREKKTADALNRAREYSAAALAWMLADQVASSIDVLAEWAPNATLLLQVTISRGTSRRWAEVWDGTGREASGDLSLGPVTLRLDWA